MKRTIFIIGLGLIGGSLAKSLKHDNNNYIIGFDSDTETVNFALKNGIIDASCEDLNAALKEAEIIILGTPISETVRIIGKLDETEFDHEVIVTDVSSVKSTVMEKAASITNKNIQFIGGHPMAGSHKHGIIAAKEHLFENAIYVLSPSKNCRNDAVDTLTDILRVTKSNFIVLPANDHDEMTGIISHFPHLIASSLVHQARKWQNTHAYIPKLAAGGFRDITRIASSNPELWQDIFYHNRKKMSHLLEDWIAEMNEIKDLIDHNNRNGITAYLQQAKDYRDGLGSAKKGAIPSFYDLYVDIRDQPGAIASVAHILATADISIKNIQILEIREGITGVLRLSVPSKEDLQGSRMILEKNGYELMVAE
ncbi:prephenate dehydrogenase [Virgibacillus siamensis]|uniref:prephenate dehydrogenase n=1 Tax=Virgibacillus siamensis TaxID=480071 RepID=UPI00158A0506|nr:prephenate dehydrogenase [Virgibacillus siamensis]